MLPGQRDGSQLWFESVTSFLHEKLGFEHCSAYPSLLRSPGGECLILLHVDDMLVVTDEEFFHGKFIPTLTGKYKTSVHCMSQAGDTFEFLKRIHVLVDDEHIHIQQNPRHFDKLFEVVGVQNTMNPKKVPCHELMCEVDDTAALTPDKATRYRSAVGILLYLASDLVECAFTIRGLAQHMSAPTERSWMMLKTSVSISFLFAISPYVLECVMVDCGIHLAMMMVWCSSSSQTQTGRLTRAIDAQSAPASFVSMAAFFWPRVEPNG